MPSNPYKFHTGMEANEAGTDQMVGDCPFCGGEQSFYFNKDDFQFDCKKGRCQLEGNTYTFIKLFHDRVCTDKIYSLDRGIPYHILEHNHVKYNPMNDTYVIPTYAENGSMNNLFKYVVANNTLYGTPQLAAPIYNFETSPERVIWLCEGLWDKMAAEAIFGVNHTDHTAVAVPGASTFKDRWTQIFRDREVVICYDNDSAGRKGVEKVIKKITESPQKPSKLSVVRWPNDYKEGYDLRDALLQFKDKAYSVISGFIEDVEQRGTVKVTPENVIEDFECDSYDKALEAFQTAYHTTEDMKAALAMVMASIWSIKFDDMEQLWLKIIGVPGSGKTRIAKAVSASDQVVSKSSFTGLFSGWKESQGDDDDHGLIPIISGKTLLVKDADALLRQPDVERIFSEMRDFYDKDSSPHYRNKVSRDYRNIKSTFIICGTQQLRSADHSFLGERFLALELDVSDEDKKAINRKVIERNVAVATGQLKQPERCIMSAMKGWINHLMERSMESELPQDFLTIIEHLSNLTAIMRTEVHRDRRRRLTTPSVPELPGRIIGQSITAAYALCVVFGLTRADTKVYNILTKVLRDTINPRSIRYRICKAFMQNPDMMIGDLTNHLGAAQVRVDDEIEDMTELGIIRQYKVASTTPGKWRWKFTLNEDVKLGLQELEDGQE